MNISRKRQSQFELFPGASKNSPEIGKSPHLTKDLTLSLENIIVLCIIFVISMVLFFSFGVEKGKRVAKISGDVKMAHKAQEPVLESAGPTTGKPQGERIIFPVNVPEDLQGEERVLQEPLKMEDEQRRLYTIQVASFKLRKNAQREADRLKGNGHEDVFVIAKGSYSIVCVGKFSQRSDAKEFSNRLQNRYNDCLVRRL